jgi:predicted Zn-dependent peptidase
MQPPADRPGLAVHEKDLEQVHLCLGTPGIPHTDPDRYAAHLLNVALGGGMSSRLFQEIRERRGKAYTVYSFLASYVDAGYTGVYVGTSPEWVREVVDVIRTELERAARDGLAPDELARVKNQMKGNILLGLETSDSRMSRIAKNAIYFGRDVPLEEVAAAVDAVSNDDILRVARRLFVPGKMALTVLGDLKGHALDERVLTG